MRSVLRRPFWPIVLLVALAVLGWHYRDWNSPPFTTPDPAAARDALPQPSSYMTGPAEVIDGDTLRVGGQRVRLLGMDAPELDQTCPDLDGPEWPCGQEAKAHLEALIAGGEVICRGYDFDRYRRILAVCTKSPEGREPIDLGEQQVLAGYAVAAYSSAALYQDAEDYAARNSLSIWTGRFIYPADWRAGQR